MNSYFASVEQQANPSLRGKPLGVVATMSPHGCIIASSKEAKAVGIKTGCRVDEALFLYPKVILVDVDPPKYRSTTEKIFSILRRYSDDIEPYSIDEAFVNLTGHVQSFEQAVAVGREIKRQVFSEAGEWLTNSIGIAPTRWLAKFGSDTCEKGGIVVLRRETLLAYLAGRDLTDAWGIAGRLSARLHVLGITTLDELALYSPYELKRALGIRGYELWANVNGIEVSQDHLALNASAPPKSIGHSHVLRKRTQELRFHRALVMRLAERTGRKLRSLGLEAGGIFAYASLDGWEQGCGGGMKLARPIKGSEEIFKHSWRIVSEGVRRGVPTSFQIGVFRLAPVTGQRTLWPQPAKAGVYSALDEINDRFGEETVTWGTLMGLEHSHAPDRVGFRKTVSPDIPAGTLMLEEPEGTRELTRDPVEDISWSAEPVVIY